MINNISTRQKIVYASVDLFALKGYTETTLRQIAMHVGIKASSIYNHFSSKEAILQEILSQYDKIINDSTPAGRKTEFPVTALTAEKLTSFMFFKFSEEDGDMYTKIIKILFAEYIRNQQIRDYLLGTIINASYNHIKSQLEYLNVMNAIKCNVNIATGIIYSIVLSFTVLSTLELTSFESEQKPDMFQLLNYTFQNVLDGKLV